MDRTTVASLIALAVLAIVMIAMRTGSKEGFAPSPSSYYLVARNNSIQAEQGEKPIVSIQMDALLKSGGELLGRKRAEVNALEENIRDKLCSLENPLKELRVRRTLPPSSDTSAVDCAVDNSCRRGTEFASGYTRMDAGLLQNMARPAMFFMPPAEDKELSDKVFLAGVGIYNRGSSLEGALGNPQKSPFYRVFSGPHEVVVTYKKYGILPARQIVIPPNRTDSYVWHWGRIQTVEIRFPRAVVYGTIPCSHFPVEGVHLKLVHPPPAEWDNRFEGTYLIPQDDSIKIGSVARPWRMEVLSGNEVTISFGSFCLTSREGDKRGRMDLEEMESPPSSRQKWTLLHNTDGTFTIFQKSTLGNGRDYLGYNRRDGEVQMLKYSDTGKVFRVRLEPLS
jgi:hypothetical protein